MFSLGIQLLLLLGAAMPISSRPTAPWLAKRDVDVQPLAKDSANLYQCGPKPSEGGRSLPHGALLERAYLFCNEKSRFGNAWPNPMPIEKTIKVTATPYYQAQTVSEVKVNLFLFNLLDSRWDVTINECYALANTLITACDGGNGKSVGGKAYEDVPKTDPTFGKRGMGLLLE